MARIGATRQQRVYATPCDGRERLKLSTRQMRCHDAPNEQSSYADISKSDATRLTLTLHFPSDDTMRQTYRRQYGVSSRLMTSTRSRHRRHDVRYRGPRHQLMPHFAHTLSCHYTPRRVQLKPGNNQPAAKWHERRYAAGKMPP